MLEVPLGRGTSNGRNRSGITMKFAFVAELRGDVNASELHATNAVEGATETGSVPRPTPQIVVQVDSAISTGTEVATQLQTLGNTWNVLLQRMALFHKIVAGSAEVSGLQRLVPSPSECRIDSPVCVAGLVCDIRRKPGLCLVQHSH